MKSINDDFNSYITQRDQQINTKTTPSIDEKIKLPTIWAFEVFPPEFIENFYHGIEKLQWLDEKIDSMDNFQDTLHDLRHRLTGGGWINLGYIRDDSALHTIPRSRTAKLPNGIQSIRASIFQPIPSTTILICQFFLDDDLSDVIDKSLRKNYQTYKQKTKFGYRIMDVEHQKRETIHLELEFLNNLCSTWIKDHFAGLYASDDIQEEHPTCAFLTLEKGIPFEEKEFKGDYLSILDMHNNFDAWTSGALQGIHLSFPRKENSVRKSLILSGNINEILKDEDLKLYGDEKENRVLNYLQYLDHTFGTWVLNVLLESYIYKITDLRDLYGKTDVHDRKKAISTITALDQEVLKSQKNILSFIDEMKYYTDNEIFFMREIYEFEAMNKTWHKEKLFAGIRKTIIYRLDLLSQNQKILKETSSAVREINTLITSDYLADTNIIIQKSMKKMTIAILILTMVSTIATVISVIGYNDVKSFVKEKYKLINERKSAS